MSKNKTNIRMSFPFYLSDPFTCLFLLINKKGEKNA